ncbi:MAG: hypothetical protein IKH11_05955 [Bacteroidales bacterium]|nr:hypothetical protein [Bacteroidales bacterium]
MNNLTQNHYSAPEVKILFICVDPLCTSSRLETATHEGYETFDLFE